MLAYLQFMEEEAATAVEGEVAAAMPATAWIVREGEGEGGIQGAVRPLVVGQLPRRTGRGAALQPPRVNRRGGVARKRERRA